MKTWTCPFCDAPLDLDNHYIGDPHVTVVSHLVFTHHPNPATVFDSVPLLGHQHLHEYDERTIESVVSFIFHDLHGVKP
jgi:hypothetical protein